jgi:hypothetical protein
MTHLSIHQEIPNFCSPLAALRYRVPFALMRTAGLELLSIGSFVGVCLALVAEFS